MTELGFGRLNETPMKFNRFTIIGLTAPSSYTVLKAATSGSDCTVY